MSRKTIFLFLTIFITLECLHCNVIPAKNNQDNVDISDSNIEYAQLRQFANHVTNVLANWSLRNTRTLLRDEITHIEETHAEQSAAVKKHLQEFKELADEMDNFNPADSHSILHKFEHIGAMIGAFLRYEGTADAELFDATANQTSWTKFVTQYQERLAALMEMFAGLCDKYWTSLTEEQQQKDEQFQNLYNSYKEAITHEDKREKLLEIMTMMLK